MTFWTFDRVLEFGRVVEFWDFGIFGISKGCGILERGEFEIFGAWNFRRGEFGRLTRILDLGARC